MQLLVRVVDKTSADPVANVQLSKRGDVIATAPDDHTWGLAEISAADYRIVKVDFTDVEAASFLVPEHGSLGEKGTPRAKRAFYIDLDTLAAVGIRFEGPRRATWDADQLTVPDVEVVKHLILAAKRKKSATVDPRGVRGPSNAIGLNAD